jgi:two-component system sensor histidine kinase AtoS
VIQILVNLILYAVQATPAGGSVRLQVTRTGPSEAAIEVRDTGTGVDEAVLARMADPFFTTKPKGSGLGLSIARQLAELQGGRLEFFSTLGEGTMVRLTLPTQGDTL